MKKIFLVIPLITLFLVQSASASFNGGFGEIFSDVKDPYPYAYQVDWLADNGIVSGYSDGKFHPGDCVTRAEFLKMMYVTLESDIHDLAAGAGWYGYFSDVDSKAWYWDYLRYALQTGTVKGYSDKTFHPGQCVKRVEAVKMAVLNFNNGKVPVWDSIHDNLIDVSHTAWYSPMLDYAHAAGVLGLAHVKVESKSAEASRVKYFPDGGMTRGEVAYLLFNLKALKDDGAVANDTSQLDTEKGNYNYERGMLMPKRLADAYVFDGCGKMNIYASQAWYAEWKTAALTANINLSNITDACFSSEAGRLIFLVDEGYMKLTSVYKYTIKGAIEKASFSGGTSEAVANIQEFGKRKGGYIPLVGVMGDAGTGTQYSFEYYFGKNVLLLKRHRIFTFDETVGGTPTQPVYSGTGKAVYGPWVND